MAYRKGLGQDMGPGPLPFVGGASGRETAQRMRGFTITELVVVIVIVGILAVVALPRMFTRISFDALRFYDDAQAAVRYAQKLAIAGRCNSVQVQTTASSIQLSVLGAAGCAVTTNTAATIPGTSGGALTAPSGVTLTAATFSFDGNGRPSFASALTLNVTATGEPTRSFVIEQETGYVHPAP
jgi:MSHA pilin protein MshC